MAADRRGIATEGTGNTEDAWCSMAPESESTSLTCSARGTYKMSHCEKFELPRLGAALNSGIQSEAMEVAGRGSRPSRSQSCASSRRIRGQQRKPAARTHGRASGRLAIRPIQRLGNTDAVRPPAGNKWGNGMVRLAISRLYLRGTATSPGLGLRRPGNRAPFARGFPAGRASGESSARL